MSVEERTTMPHIEMTLPKSRGEIMWTGFFSLIVVVFAFFALLNLVDHIAVIPSVLWLLFVAWILWSGCRDAGGVRRFLIDWFSPFAGRKFAVLSHDGASIRFGYELFGRRFYQKDIEIERIETVSWSPGQATGMAGRDMKDWCLALWYDHRNPEKSNRHHTRRKPAQDIYIVGPSRRKEDTATLGMEFVSFLNGVGVHLMRGEGNNVYFREVSRTYNV